MLVLENFSQFERSFHCSYVAFVMKNQRKQHMFSDIGQTCTGAEGNAESRSFVGSQEMCVCG